MTPHLRSNEPLEHECIVVGSATRIKVSCQQGIAIEHGGLETINESKIIDIVFLRGLTAVADQWILWAGNVEMSNR
jgi:hypothetical protein